MAHVLTAEALSKRNVEALVWVGQQFTTQGKIVSHLDSFLLFCVLKIKG